MLRPNPGPGIGRLPLAYLATAATAFVAAAAAVPWLAPELAGHYYQPRVLALTHTVTLGWITLTIMGASYQLVPVLLECPVWSDRLAWWQLGFAVLGTVAMVGHFYIGEWVGLVWGTGLVALAVLAHVLNIAFSLRGIRRWTFTALTIAFALGGLALTTLAGVALGVDHLMRFLPWLAFPRVHAHFHLAVLGWVLPMVVGVSARAYPMFLVAPEPSRALTTTQLAGLAIGVPLVVVGLLGSPMLLLAGAVGVAVVVAAHLAGVVAMTRARRRPRLDWGLTFVLTGAAFLLPASLLAIALAAGIVGGPRVSLAYATLVLGGWASLTIAGMMLKIVPFLVWYRVYASRAGRETLPTVADLSSPTAEGLSYALLTAGVLGLIVALWVGDISGIRMAGLVLAAGALVFVTALGRVFGRLRPSAERWAGTAAGAMR